jgi:hypothetical protein
MTTKAKLFLALAISTASMGIAKKAFADVKPKYYWKDLHDVCTTEICDQDKYSCPCG